MNITGSCVHENRQTFFNRGDGFRGNRGRIGRVTQASNFSERRLGKTCGRETMRRPGASATGKRKIGVAEKNQEVKDVALLFLVSRGSH